MCDATGLTPFAEKFPKRFFDVGIAEAHAVTFAAGLAKTESDRLRQFIHLFLQRAYDQIFRGCMPSESAGSFAIDRAGIVGADGETHHGVFDLSYLSSMPNMTVLAPKDGTRLCFCTEVCDDA